MTPRQLEILQHALGADKYGDGGGYRNHFCAGSDDEPDCMALVEMGYMRVFRPNASPYPYYNVTVTGAGKEAMKAASPAPPKLTQSQIRYREFLHADSGMRFGEWLKWRGEMAKEDPVKWGLRS